MHARLRAGWDSLSRLSPSTVTACAVLSVEKDAGVCWGRQLVGEGRLANFSEPTYAPFDPTGARNWQALSTGSYTNASTQVEDSYACGLDTDDNIWCWGSDFSGVGLLGAGRPQSSAAPLALADDGPWERMAVGDGSACAIKYEDSTLWCWGSNVHSKLGESSSSGCRCTEAGGGLQWRTRAGMPSALVPSLKHACLACRMWLV